MSRNDRHDPDAPPADYHGPQTEAEARARGLCGAETRQGTPCRKYPVDGGERCRFHGGASTGPTDVEHLEGNDRAVGNDGGAPEGNTNAIESGAFVALEKIPARLTREQLHGVARWEWWAVLASRARRPALGEGRRRRLARRWALLRVRMWTAATDVWTDGEDGGRGFYVDREETVETADGETTVTIPRANPSFAVEHRAARKRRKIGDVLGLYEHDRGGRQADVRAAPPTPSPVDRAAKREGRR